MVASWDTSLPREANICKYFAAIASGGTGDGRRSPRSRSARHAPASGGTGGTGGCEEQNFGTGQHGFLGNRVGATTLEHFLRRLQRGSEGVRLPRPFLR